MSVLGGRHVAGGAAAAAACSLCCAAPVVGFLGLAGFATTAVTLAFAGVVFGAVVGLVTLTALLARRVGYPKPRSHTAPLLDPIPLELGTTRTNEPG